MTFKIERRFEPRRTIRSVLFKTTILIAMTAAIVAAALTARNLTLTRSVASDGLRQLGGEVTFFVADQASGALRFGRAEALDELLTRALSTAEGRALGFVLRSEADGAIVARQGTIPPDAMAELEELMNQAIRTGTPVYSETGFHFAYPVLAAGSGAAIGAAASTWDAAPLLARINAEKRQTLIISAVALTICLGIGLLVLRPMITSPMSRLGKSLGRMADGNLDIEILDTGRKDEIGRLARSLETCRVQLKSAAEADRQGMIKGAGFMASQTPLCMVNPDGTISFVNPAFDALMRADGGFAISRDAVSSFEGKSFVAIHPALEPIAAALLGTGDGAAEDLRVGSRDYAISAAPVASEAGTSIGSVVQIQDTTETQLNDAILTTLDNHGVRAIFSLDGQLVEANAAFIALLEASGTRQGDAWFGTTLMPVDAKGDPVPEARALLSAVEPTNGMFRLDGKAGNGRWIQGNLIPVSNRAGVPLCHVLIGSDTTETWTTTRRAEALQEEMRANQQHMIETLRDAFSELSNGDLKVRLTNSFAGENDQVRTDFNQSVEALHDAIVAVLAQSVTIGEEADEIARGGEDLARRTEQQAATLEETAAALAEITNSVQSAAEGAGRANVVVREAREKAEQSGDVVREAVVAMGEIADSSNQISKIIGVIDDIAFQTNLLALNAGVEAARAGDAGRGFAVVASEVRALAQRSSDAAREINSLISTSRQHVDRGVTLVGDAGEALERIVTSVSGISDHVAGITASSEEQSNGLAEVNTAVGQLDVVTQKNAAMFQHTVSGSKKLLNAAKALRTAIDRFRVDDTSLKASSPALDIVPAPGRAAAVPEAPEPTPSTPDTLRATGTDDGKGFDDDTWDDF
ncbi:MAG: methyl-accepting chemotaxis protein [Pseudomonadota bacterium]